MSELSEPLALAGRKEVPAADGERPARPKQKGVVMSSKKSGSAALAVGGIAAIMASACCLGPLLLVSLGLGGAWVGNLHMLEPFRPAFIGASLVAMFFAWRRIYRPVAECNPGDICALPQTKRLYKCIFWVVAAMAVAALTFPYIAPLFY